MRGSLQSRARINDAFRLAISLAAIVLGAACAGVQRIRIATFSYSQAFLRRRYRIAPGTPILSYGREVEAGIERAAQRNRGSARLAETSGSTAAPKRLLYTPRRLRSARWAFIDHFVRMFFAQRARRTSLYVFRPLQESEADRSLTSMLVEERGLPSYLAALQAPYRVEGHPAIQDLARRYGAAAVRLWILAIANPGALYCTNPSTLWIFLHELTANWERSRRLVADFHADSNAFGVAVLSIAANLDSVGRAERIARIAGSEAPLPFSVCAPAVRTIVCWTGGYLKSFLDRIAAALPPDRYRIEPMYSISTETIETTARFTGGTTSFVPLAPRVFYEFIEEGLPDLPENLLPPGRLEPGKAYTLVVSDPYGLRRYQTEDVFRCNGFTCRLPDLQFLRRRNLEYSFTGEKVSSLHLGRVLTRLGGRCSIPADVFLTCVPSHPADEPVPHYRIVMACRAPRSGSMDLWSGAIAIEWDRLLSEENAEYRAKRSSGRLGVPRLSCLSLADFMAAFGGNSSGPDGQFKFLPLYSRTWEDAFASRLSFSPGRFA